MEGNVKRVLFVNSEMTPYLEETPISSTTRFLAQGIQEKKMEIRSFMPRYGLINERKNQLHEVIRLSGMNIVIGDVDRPLIIKVASLPSARMQVYFIDNEDFFRRKALYRDASGHFFKDNGQRAIFFARGVLETVKKLRWSPDIIHCSGWITHVLPLYLKKCYKDDPIFAGSKVVVSLFNDNADIRFDNSFAQDIRFQGAGQNDAVLLEQNPSGINLAKLALAYSDGVILETSDIPSGITACVREQNLPVLDNSNENIQGAGSVDKYKQFYDNL